jgi:hypothetical protein
MWGWMVGCIFRIGTEGSILCFMLCAKDFCSSSAIAISIASHQIINWCSGKSANRTTRLSHFLPFYRIISRISSPTTIPYYHHHHEVCFVCSRCFFGVIACPCLCRSVSIVPVVDTDASDGRKDRIGTSQVLERNETRRCHQEFV